MEESECMAMIEVQIAVQSGGRVQHQCVPVTVWLGPGLPPGPSGDDVAIYHHAVNWPSASPRLTIRSTTGARHRSSDRMGRSVPHYRGATAGQMSIPGWDGQVRSGDHAAVTTEMWPAS